MHMNVYKARRLQIQFLSIWNGLILGLCLFFLNPLPALSEIGSADCSYPVILNMTLEQSLKRHSAIQKCRIENGQDVDETNEYGRTPLSQAVNSNDVDFIQFLLARGANINISKGKIMFTSVGNMFYLGNAETELQRQLTRQQKIEHVLKSFEARFLTLELLLKSGGKLSFADQNSSRHPNSLLHVFVFHMCKKRFSSLNYYSYFERVVEASDGQAKLLSNDLEKMKVWMRINLEGDEAFDKRCLTDALNKF